MKGNFRSVDKTVRKLRKLAEQGVTIRDAAAKVRLKPATVRTHARNYNLPFPRDGRGRKKTSGPTQRTAQMAACYQQGFTLQQIGEQFGVTRERVRQIIRLHHGLTWKSGGQHKTATENKARRDAKRNARSLMKWGCSFEQYIDLRGLKRPTRAYSQQRRNAFSRGIKWEFNLWQWWCVWQQSGHWDQRGRGQGYVMCRKNDAGPYSPDNVFIALAVENNSEGSRKKSGLPRGVRKDKRCARYFAVRNLHGVKHRLGSFPTPELAFAAYLSLGAQS